MHFYKILYTSNKHRSSILKDALQIFTENIIPLENDDKLSCEGKVTQEECLKALNEFKNEKSPGTVGYKQNFINTSGRNCMPICYTVLIMPKIAGNYRFPKDGES